MDFPRAQLLTLLDTVPTHLRFNGVHRMTCLETNEDILPREGAPLWFQLERQHRVA